MLQVVLLLGLVVYWRSRAVPVRQSCLRTYNPNHHPPGEEWPWVVREYMGRQCVSGCVGVWGRGVCEEKVVCIGYTKRWKSLRDIHY